MLFVNVLFGPSWASGRFDVQNLLAEKRDEKGNEGIRKGEPTKKQNGIQTTEEKLNEKGDEQGCRKGCQKGH